MTVQRTASALALLVVLSGACRHTDETPEIAVQWPPAEGQPFPDLTVLDHEGQRVSLASFAGKVVLVEPIGMSCAGCIAFCGGGEFGAFAGVEPQRDLGSLEEYLDRFGDGADLDDPDLAVIQMLFFDPAMQTPTVADAARWARHFQVDRRPNHHVVLGPESLRETTLAAIPGYWLLDRDFVLRCDAAGHHPPSNLYTDLLPMVAELLRGEASAPR